MAVPLAGIVKPARCVAGLTTYAIKSVAACARIYWSKAVFNTSIRANVVFFTDFNTVVPQN